MTKDQVLLGRLLKILSRHCGEAGSGEDAAETLERILRERSDLRKRVDRSDLRKSVDRSASLSLRLEQEQRSDREGAIRLARLRRSTCDDLDCASEDCRAWRELRLQLDWLAEAFPFDRGRLGEV